LVTFRNDSSIEETREEEEQPKRNKKHKFKPFFNKDIELDSDIVISSVSEEEETDMNEMDERTEIRLSPNLIKN
jgi:hypothetical protein